MLLATGYAYSQKNLTMGNACSSLHLLRDDTRPLFLHNLRWRVFVAAVEIERLWDLGLGLLGLGGVEGRLYRRSVELHHPTQRTRDHGSV